MTDDNLSDLVEKAGDRVDADGPPIAEIGSGDRRGRRRRTLVVTFASAAVVATVIGGTALLSSLGDSADPEPPVASPTAVVTPAGTRLVGLGHAAIAVATEWGTNKTHCGVPQEDTVVIDVAATEACGTRRPRGVDSVEIWDGRPPRLPR